MADKKISALTAATTPLAGTEVLPIVQSGSTVKVSVANLTAGRAISATNGTFGGNIELSNGADRYVQIGSSSNYNYKLKSVADDFQILDGAGSVRLTIAYPTGNITVGQGNLVVGTAGKGIDFSANTNAPGMTSELLNDYEEGTWTPSVSATSGAITTVGTVVGRYTKIGRQVTIHYQVAITNNGTGGGFLTIQGLPFTPTTALSQFTGIGSNASSAKSTVSTIDGGVIYVRYYDATYPVASGEIVFGTITYEV